MRILMLAQFYPPVIGGEERHVQALSTELMVRGHDVSIATLRKEGMPAFEWEQGVRVHRIFSTLQRSTVFFHKKVCRYATPFPDPEVLWAIGRIVRHECPDVVHAHNWLVHSFTPLKVWNRAKLVVTLHDSSLVCMQKRFMYHGTPCDGPGLMKCLDCSTDFYGAVTGVPATLANWGWREIERRVVDMFLPVSQSMVTSNQLVECGLPFRIIPNFIPDNMEEENDNVAPFVAQLPEEEFMLFVGDIRRDKGVEVLLRAYAAQSGQTPLVLIGHPYFDFPASVPPNVQVLQDWPHAAVMSAWRRCVIALVPSILPDACPTVAMEAMAAGKPVIASRVGGLSDIICDGETGFLVPPGDVEALQDAMQCLLGDPMLRMRMGVCARQRVIKFQARTVVPQIEHVYREVLQV